jgi:hypothetical protein
LFAPKVPPDFNHGSDSRFHVVAAASQGQAIDGASRCTADDLKGIASPGLIAILADHHQSLEHTHLVRSTCATTGENECGFSGRVHVNLSASKPKTLRAKSGPKTHQG